MELRSLYYNNFLYDIEDNLWYHKKSMFRVGISEYGSQYGFNLYYGGYDKYFGRFYDEELFLSTINDYLIKLSRLEKLKKINKLHNEK